MTSPTKLPPAKPSYVFRGHGAPVHAVCFSPSNHRLLTADADGWIVSWSLVTRRPKASWRAHAEAVLGLAWWGEDAVISHGRDSKLVVWSIQLDAEHLLATTLPISIDGVRATEPTGEQRPRIVHEMTVNTLNFCSFAWCFDSPADDPAASSMVSLASPQKPLASENSLVTHGIRPPLLLAVPHTLDSSAIDIHRLSPIVSEDKEPDRLSTVPAPPEDSAVFDPKLGLVMAIAFPHPRLLVVGYESGHVLGFARRGPLLDASSVRVSDEAGGGRATARGSWQAVYRARPHSQPVLSLAVVPSALAMGAASVSQDASRPEEMGSSHNETRIISTAADAIIARHVFVKSSSGGSAADPTISQEQRWPAKDQPVSKIYKSGHAGQQGARVRDDGRVLATAGWDGRVRVYSGKTLKEVAVLSGWGGAGGYATDWARTVTRSTWIPDTEGHEAEGEGPGETVEGTANGEKETDGWGGVEVEEIADVLNGDTDPGTGQEDVEKDRGGFIQVVEDTSDSETRLDRQSHRAVHEEHTRDSLKAQIARPFSRQQISMSMDERRESRAQNTHWLAAGFKNGKVGLWDIF